MTLKDFLPEIELSNETKRKCVEIMKETGDVPAPAPDAEANAIVSWLNFSKKDWPNCMTYIYKDCCFQKSNGKWFLALRNNDFQFAKLLEKGRQNG